MAKNDLTTLLASLKAAANTRAQAEGAERKLVKEVFLRGGSLTDITDATGRGRHWARSVKQELAAAINAEG